MVTNWGRLLLLLAPILIIQIGLATVALLDLARRKAVRGPRGLWLGLLILATFSFPAGVLISGLYLAWGRNPDLAQAGEVDDPD